VDTNVTEDRQHDDDLSSDSGIDVGDTEIADITVQGDRHLSDTEVIEPDVERPRPDAADGGDAEQHDALIPLDVVLSDAPLPDVELLDVLPPQDIQQIDTEVIPDIQVLDVPTLDVLPIDVEVPDQWVPDALLVDVQPLDVEQIDTAVPHDQWVLDMSLPDILLQDLTPQDALPIDVEVPDQWVPDASWPDILPDAEPPPPVELCNGEDDDGDGLIDEDFPRLNQACGIGVGACYLVSTIVCSLDELETICSAEPGEPGEEECDGIDNDCDGEIDEDLSPPAEQACPACDTLTEGQNIATCNGDDGWVCPDCPPPDCIAVEELCDGEDNDCDGEVDEDFELLNQPCEVGIGACHMVGINVCNQGENGVACNVVPDLATDEICDGVDNDCDGEIDNDPILSPECETDLLGICNAGHEICLHGEIICQADLQPELEICDELDNDCDGETDEFVELGEEMLDDYISRFIEVCGNNPPLIWDRQSDLVWDRHPQPVWPGVKYTQEQAVEACSARDMRLPSLAEVRDGPLQGCPNTSTEGVCDPDHFVAADCTCGENPGIIQGPGEGGCYYAPDVWHGECNNRYDDRWTSTCQDGRCWLWTPAAGRLSLGSTDRVMWAHCVRTH
jgi:hypothetical protein